MAVSTLFIRSADPARSSWRLSFNFEVRSRMGGPLADARGSDRATTVREWLAQYVTVIPNISTKRPWIAALRDAVFRGDACELRAQQPEHGGDLRPVFA